MSESDDPKRKDLRDCDSVSELTATILEEQSGNVAILSLALRGSAGVSRVIEQQAEELNRNGYNVTLFVLENDVEPPENVDLKVLGSPSNFYLNKIHHLSYPINIPALIRGIWKLRDFDILIAHRYPLTFLAYIVAHIFSVPYVVWHHHVPDPDSMPDFPQRVFMKILEYFEEKSWIVKEADVVCSVSDSSREILLEKSGRDSLVISNEAVVKRFEDVTPEILKIKEKYGITSEDPVVLFVGRLTATKNIHELIKVFDWVCEEIPEAKLVIAGKPTVPDYFNDLQRQASENVIFTGFIPDGELLALYMACDVFATCSLREGQGLPPSEAQEFGAKVVGFNVPGIRDDVREGTLVEPEDYETFAEETIKLLSNNG